MSTAEDAAAILIERRQTGQQGEQLPPQCRPTTTEEALAIQSAVSKGWCERMDDSIGGWKCLLPTTDKCIVGPIYTGNIDSTPPVSLWPQASSARIEPELAFFFDRDFPPREIPYSPAEIDAAICRTHLALELIHGRYATPSNCSFVEMLADGLVNQGLFIGPLVDNHAAKNASQFNLLLSHGAENTSYDAKHPNGDPRAPLYWLVNFLPSIGYHIIAGQAVITGSFAGVLQVPLNQEITLNYQGLGSFSVSFLSKKASKG